MLSARSVGNAASLFFLAWCSACAAPVVANRVLLVSIDGLVPSDLDRMPHLAELARRGSRGTLTPVFPTVTWPNHTSLLTGVTPARHGVVGNRMFDRASGHVFPAWGEPGLDTLPVDNLLRAVMRIGQGAGALLWPMTQGMKGLACNVPEVYLGEGLPPEIEPVERAGLVRLLQEESAMLDRFTTDRAAACLPRTRFLVAHYLAVDTWKHRVGPDGLGAVLARAGVDEAFGRLAAAARAAGATIIVVSDHGFFAAERVVDLNRVLAGAGFVAAPLLVPAPAGFGMETPEIQGSRAHAVQSGGYAFVFALDATAAPAMRETLVKAPCVGQVISSPGALAALGLPSRAQSARAPDMVALPAPGCQFKALAGPPDAAISARVSADGLPVGVHGALPSLPEMQAVLVAAGPGIRKGVTLHARSIDVAPTIAQLLGVTLATPQDGRVLQELLTRPASRDRAP